MIPGMMAPPGLGLALGAGGTIGNLLQMPTFGSIASGMSAEAIEGGLASALAGGGMDEIVAAAAEAAGAALAEVGFAGVAAASGVAVIAAGVVGGLFEVGMGIGFGIAEGATSIGNFVSHPPGR